MVMCLLEFKTLPSFDHSTCGFGLPLTLAVSSMLPSSVSTNGVKDLSSMNFGDEVISADTTGFPLCISTLKVLDVLLSTPVVATNL